MMRSLLLCLLLALCAAPLIAQTATVYPPVFYPSENVMTISSPRGIREITAVHSPNVEVEGEGVLEGCPKSHEIRVSADGAGRETRLNLDVTDCDGRRTTISPTFRGWDLDTIRFRVELGTEDCQLFRIRNGAGGIAGLGSGSIILDSVTSPDERVHINIPTRLPLTIPQGVEFRYEVCYDAQDLGLYQFPVITWMRREVPVGELTTYPVADTGVVRVMPPNKPPEDQDWIPDPPSHDPTTFRSVAVPNAITPPKGKFIVGSYDLLGIIVGYAPTDNLMILGGGALPTPDDWGGFKGEGFGAYSLGLKWGTEIGQAAPNRPRLNAALGYQIGRSMFDKELTPETESQITFHAPYAALSYGTDSARISATFGYIFKNHKTFIEDPAGNFIDDYDRKAPMLAIGGDYQFANHWKVAAEVATMKTLGVIPIVATARYFSDNYAIDFGVGYVGLGTDEESAPAIPLLPVLSGVFRF